MSERKQLFGNIEVDGVHWDAMLCRDLDEPNHIVIHWYGRNVPRAGAALLKLYPLLNQKFSGEIISLWNADVDGGLLLADQEAWESAKNITITLEETQNGFSGLWTYKTQNDASGKITFVDKLVPDREPNLTICESWDDFRKWAAQLQKNATPPIFRGHGNSKWKLETSCFRSGQTRMERFTSDTLTSFASHTEAILDRAFDFTNGADYSTLLGLAQHHGLPTPLLDFTDSPYIAAYFAFSDAIDNDLDQNNYVRVYALSGEYLRRSSPPNVRLATAWPYVVGLSISGRHNPRLYVQQGRFLVTNVGNLESYLLAQSSSDGPVLQAANISMKCALDALADLKYMGLTSATLFPGLDGLCKMMRQDLKIRSKNRSLTSLLNQGSTLQPQQPQLDS